MGNVDGHTLVDPNKATKALLDLINGAKQVLDIRADTDKGILYLDLEQEDGSVVTRSAYLCNHLNGTGELREEAEITAGSLGEVLSFAGTLRNPTVEYEYEASCLGSRLTIVLRRNSDLVIVKQTFTLEAGIYAPLGIEIFV